MSDVAALAQRAEHLEVQVEALQRELKDLRRDLARVQPSNAGGAARAPVDCLAVALAVAEDLGPEFSSEDAHGLADRGGRELP
jgi:hypothetical protein